MASGPRAAATGIAVIVLNFRSHELLERNLTNLDVSAVNVVVVDNFSSTRERDDVAAAAHRHGWHLVAMPDNRGFGAGVNAGVQAAINLGHQSFLLLNPDARVEMEVVRGLADHIETNPMALISPKVVDSAGASYFAGYAVLESAGRMRRVENVAQPPAGSLPWISGACMAFSRQLFEAVGGFDESYFLYWEDVDFSIRAAHAGAQLDVLKHLTAVHDEGGTQGERRGRAKSDYYYRYNCRNRLLFGSKFLTARTLARWIALTPRESWQIVLHGGRRQLLYSRAPLIAAFVGTCEGLTIVGGVVLRRLRAAAVARWRRDAGPTPPQVHRR